MGQFMTHAKYQETSTCHVQNNVGQVMTVTLNIVFMLHPLYSSSPWQVVPICGINLTEQ
jgi:hypothetical protein